MVHIFAVQDGITLQQTGQHERRTAARERVGALVRRYAEQRASYVRSGSGYNEAQVRVDFLNPFLKALGWDLDNENGMPQHLREVIQEDAVMVEEADQLREKNPDYTLRVAGSRAFFLEAKKPSVHIENSREAAFQARRYGWSANLQMSVLSNFEHLAVYDSRYRPRLEEEAPTARYRLYRFSEYVERFDEIYDLLSKDRVYAGSITETFAANDYRGVEPFDAHFLSQIERWREDLARSLLAGNRLDAGQLNYLIQRLINRIIFLRVCEGRNLETYERLKHVRSYAELRDIFVEADRRYNSGLFDFAEDTLSLRLIIEPDILVAIFQDLYLPNSPYAFSVVEPDIIGEIYETYLGRQIAVGEGGAVAVVEKPEVAVSNGVVPTPNYVAREVVSKTLAPLVSGKSPDELGGLRVADLSCGSGVFLLAAYDYLVNHAREWYVAHGPENFPDKVYQGAGQSWYLSLGEKERLLLGTIFGVDVDLQAAEVARFSLLLRFIEDETAASISSYVDQRGTGALPSLEANIRWGNSLVDERYFDFNPEADANEALLTSVRPMAFEIAFPEVMREGGFSAIVGNPPYVRIQNLVRYFPEELAFYRSELGDYSTAAGNNIDKYYLFIERAMSLLRADGRLGYIVPHKFFVLKAGTNLRDLISRNRYLAEITHFGVSQVFPGRATYTAIVVLSRAGPGHFTVERVTDISAWRRGVREGITSYAAAEVGKAPWVFVSPQAKSIFERVRGQKVRPLKHFAKIFVGLQTSKDDIYIHPIGDSAAVYDVATREFTGERLPVTTQRGSWELETSILVPCIKDAEVSAFERVYPNAAMIFPYRPGTRTPYTEGELRERFPNTWAYLSAHRTDLEARNVSGGEAAAWYRFGRSQSLLEFDDRPKLVWKTLATEAPYAYDDLNTRFTGGGNGPYYGLSLKAGTPISIFFLLAILFHPVIEAMVRSRASVFRGSYYSHGKQFLEDIPVHDVDLDDPAERAAHDRVASTARRLVDVTDRLRRGGLTPSSRGVLASQQDRFKRTLVGLVSGLYGLSPEDVSAVVSGNLPVDVRDES